MQSFKYLMSSFLHLNAFLSFVIMPSAVSAKFQNQTVVFGRVNRQLNGATTLARTTFSITTLSITIKTTLCLTTVSIQCSYAECMFFIVVLSVVLLNVVATFKRP